MMPKLKLKGWNPYGNPCGKGGVSTAFSGRTTDRPTGYVWPGSTVARSEAPVFPAVAIVDTASTTTTLDVEGVDHYGNIQQIGDRLKHFKVA